MVKNSPAKAGDIRGSGSIPGLGRSRGEGSGNLLQYSCLGYPMDRGGDLAHLFRTFQGEALQIAVKRREVKSKGEKETHVYLWRIHFDIWQN